MRQGASLGSMDRSDALDRVIQTGCLPYNYSPCPSSACSPAVVTQAAAAGSGVDIHHVHFGAHSSLATSEFQGNRTEGLGGKASTMHARGRRLGPGSRRFSTSLRSSYRSSPAGRTRTEPGPLFKFALAKTLGAQSTLEFGPRYGRWLLRSCVGTPRASRSSSTCGFFA